MTLPLPKNHPSGDANDLRQRARTLVESLLSERRFDRAVEFLSASMEELTAGNSNDANFFWFLAAKAHFGVGDTSNALRMARRAETEMGHHGETTELAQVYLILGSILREMGQMNQAERSLRDAESISRRHDDHVGRGEALNKLARLAFMRADYNQAVSLLNDAIDLARREEDIRKLAYLYGNLGRVQTFLGLSQDAARNLRMNIELSDRLDDHCEVAKARLSLGYELMRLELLGEAQAEFEAASVIIDQRGMARERVIYLTYNGELQTRRLQFALAGESLAEALRLAERFSPSGDLVARAKRMMAELALCEGNCRAAQRLAAEATELFERLEEKADLGALSAIMAQAAAGLDANTECERRFEAAFQILEEAHVQYELAQALEAAGHCAVFHAHRRLAYLFRAREIHAHRGDSIARERIDLYVNQEPTLSLGVWSGLSAVSTRGLAVANSANMAPKTTSKPGASDGNLILKNPRMRKIVAQLELLSKSDLPLLFTGETGVGKGALAKYYHTLARPHGPFVALNVTNVPESLLESELFGHARGAYTDAVESVSGLLASANGGTLFLDEIGEMPLGLQMRLLTVIEEKRFRPVGSVKEIAVDFLLVTATNCDLKKMVDEGRFRRDLYHRLDGFTFDIPPLRERSDEIPMLLTSSMRRYGLLGPTEEAEPELVRQFMSHSWPGNIRELENMVKRMKALSSMVLEGSLVELVRGVFTREQEIVAANLFDRVERFERDLITAALESSGGNKSRAARDLGIHESTLRAKMKRFDLEDESSQNRGRLSA